MFCSTGNYFLPDIGGGPKEEQEKTEFRQQ
jgi:hypothetical protein